MRCPDGCTEPLVMTDRSGIEIDYCPNCRGVWLQRGELDKIIERNAAPAAVAATATTQGETPRNRDDRYDDDRNDGRRRKKERGGFLGELFEF